MDILYASIKHDIILAIERSVIATYAKIDFRSADSFGLCLKKQIHIYRRLLSELNFTPFMEEIGIILFRNSIQTIAQYLCSRTQVFHQF